MTHLMANAHRRWRGVWRFPALERCLYHVFGEKKAARDVFDAWAREGRDVDMEKGHGPVALRLLNRLELPPDAWYLDLGCGNGYTVRWVADRVPRGRAVGIDVSPEMIRRARETSTAFPRAEFHEAAFPAHGLPLESFDAVLSIEAIYYLPDLEGALAEIRRLLKPGGTFVSAVDFYLENKASRMWPVSVETPMKLLSAAEWLRTFEEAGFTELFQERLTIPKDEAVESWHTTYGALVTSGRKPLRPA